MKSLLAQMKPPIAAHFCIARSVCRLSHSCFLLKLFHGFRYHLAGTVLYQMGSLTPHGKEDLGVSWFWLTKKWFTIHQVAPSTSDSASYPITLVVVVIYVTQLCSVMRVWMHKYSCRSNKPIVYFFTVNCCWMYSRRYSLWFCPFFRLLLEY